MELLKNLWIYWGRKESSYENQDGLGMLNPKVKPLMGLETLSPKGVKLNSFLHDLIFFLDGVVAPNFSIWINVSLFQN